MTATTSSTMPPSTYASPGRLPGKYSHSTYNLAIMDRETESEAYLQTNHTSNNLPEPLNISKQEDGGGERDENEDETPRAARFNDAGRTRSISPSLSQSSFGSERSSVSMDSLPEPLGGERPLTIPKRRDNNANRGSQIRGGDTFCNGPNGRKENERQEQGITDVMASLGRMTLNDNVPENKGGGIYGARTGSPMTTLQSIQNRTSHIPRAQPRLSNKPSLMFLDRRYHGSGSESTYSCYSDTNSDIRPGFSRIPQRPSPSLSLRSTPSVSSAHAEAYGSRQSVRSSPYLRSVKSMHHMSTTALPIHGYDGELSVSPPISAATTGGLNIDVPGGDGNGSRNYSADSRQSSFDDPYILVPKIIVTPETKILEDGATGLWAAVQISTQIRPANSTVYQADDSQTVRGPSQLDVFRYGCLYNVSVEVLATESSVIVELLDDKSYALNTTLYPGSRLLIMAHVKLLNHLASSTGSVHGLRHARQSSDDLIQDLEHHLGNKLVEYLQIRIRYHHSSFPHHKQDQTTNSDGILDVDTSIETIARAAIKQHNSSSLWSPRPAIQHNPLFEIIASHWGPTSAGEVMQRIINSHGIIHHSVERKVTPLQTRSLPVIQARPVSREYRGFKFSPVKEGSEETLKPVIAPVPTRMPPPIPKRQASLHCTPPKAASVEQLQTPGNQSKDLTPNKKTVWSQLRKTSLTEQGNKPKTVTVQRSFIKSSVVRVPSVDLAHSASHGAIQAPSSHGFQFPPQAAAGSERTDGGSYMAQTYTLRGTRSLNNGTLKPGHTDTKQQGPDSHDHSGDYFTPSTASPKTGPSVTEWGATIRSRTLGRSSKRGGNEMVDEERAKRRQKMLMEQAATISLARGNSNKRGSMGTLSRGGGGTGTLDSHGPRRYRHPPLSAGLYRGGEEQSLNSGGGGQRGVADQGRNEGGNYRYGTKGKKDEKSGAGGTATGRWGWTGWWP